MLLRSMLAFILPTGVRTELRGGWRALCVAAIGLPISFMPGAAGEVFLLPMSHDFRLSLTSMSTVGIIGGIGSILSGPLDGYLIDRLGFRAVILLYTAMSSLCIATISITSGGIWILYGVGFFSSLVGSGWTTNYVRAISEWFSAARGTAIGIVFTAGGLACSAAPLLAQWIIDRYGWRISNLSLSGLVLLSWPLAYFWLRTPNEPTQNAGAEIVRADEGISLRDATRTPFFRFLSLAWLLSGLAGGGMCFLVPFLCEQGMSADAAAGCLSASYLAGAVVHPLLGLINDRWCPPFVAAIAFLLNATALALLGLFGAEHAVMATLITGIGVSGLSNSFFNCIPRYFGLRSFGEVSGLIQSVGTVAGMVGPLLFSILRDLTGAYTVPYIVVAITTATAGICMLECGRQFRTHPLSVTVRSPASLLTGKGTHRCDGMAARSSDSPFGPADWDADEPVRGRSGGSGLTPG